MNGGKGWCLTGRRLGRRRRRMYFPCISPPVLQPASALVLSGLLSLQKKVRTFCCFQPGDGLPGSMQGGVNLRSALGGGVGVSVLGHQILPWASKSPRDRDDIILQAGERQASLCSPVRCCGMAGTERCRGRPGSGIPSAQEKQWAGAVRVTPGWLSTRAAGAGSPRERGRA